MIDEAVEIGIKGLEPETDESIGFYMVSPSGRKIELTWNEMFDLIEKLKSL